jgi:hypothetical protein
MSPTKLRDTITLYNFIHTTTEDGKDYVTAAECRAYLRQIHGEILNEGEYVGQLLVDLVRSGHVTFRINLNTGVVFRVESI